MLVVAISLHASKTRYSQKLSQEGDCNGHTVNTWLTPSLLGLQYQSTVDLRSYLQIQLNQLRINHQRHIDAPV